MATIKNDGNLQFGTRKVTIDKQSPLRGSIGGSITDVVLNDVTASRAASTTERNDENGTVDGQVSVESIHTFTATAQLRQNQSIPFQGDEITEDFGYGSETYYIETVDKNEGNSGPVLKTYDMTCRKLQN